MDIHLKTTKDKFYPRTGHEGTEGVQRCNYNLSLTSALDRGGWSKPRSGLFTPGKRDPAPDVQQAVWAPGPIWTGAENLAATEIQSPDRPACNESLYRLREDNIKIHLNLCQSLDSSVNRVIKPWAG